MAGTPETPAIRALDLESIVPAGVSLSDAEPMQRRRRRSPTVLAGLALLAGLGAMVLGGAAVVAAGRDDDDSIVAQRTSARASAPTRIDRGTVLFLAKPSTRRIPFTGAAGRLVLAVGSGGRAAIVVRSGWRVPAGKPYGVWVVRRDGSLRRAAVFAAAERVVPLPRPLPRPATVFVAPQRADGTPAARQRVVARVGR